MLRRPPSICFQYVDVQYPLCQGVDESFPLMVNAKCKFIPRRCLAPTPTRSLIHSRITLLNTSMQITNGASSSSPSSCSPCSTWSCGRKSRHTRRSSRGTRLSGTSSSPPSCASSITTAWRRLIRLGCSRSGRRSRSRRVRALNSTDE